MEPGERRLLERSLKLSEENNKMLRKLERRARWAITWGFIKITIIVVPLIIGYLYLEPYFEEAARDLNSIRELLNL
jgi:hypothetical protein